MKYNYTREANPDLFYKLLSILDYCYAPTKASIRGMNDAAVRRALGISRRTLDKMRNECPQWPWWPSVMRDAVSDILPSLPQWKRRVINKKLRELPEDYIMQIEQATEARDWLIDQLKDGPAVSSELLSTANRGNISVDRIKRAAKALGVVKGRSGKGKDHVAVWSLPTHEDE
jgi:hypothetical protein